MASANSKLIFFVLLLSAAAAAAVAGGEKADDVVGGGGGGGGPASCEPGQGVVPRDPLPGCRAYLLHRCAGGDPPGVRARCCHQLREVAAPCRCEALRAMVEVLVEEEEAPPRCKKGAMAAIAAGLPGREECDLEITSAGAGAVNGDVSGDSRYCPKVIVN